MPSFVPAQESFNSPVGIRWIGTTASPPPRSATCPVSIPQSEFDGLGLHLEAGKGSTALGFNSPVGIRWIGTQEYNRAALRVVDEFQFPSRNSMDWDVAAGRRWGKTYLAFQFPSRNSMDWDLVNCVMALPVISVSIPQSEFDGLGRILFICFPAAMGVSIPQSEFDGLGRGWTGYGTGLLGCFNSPVGIRWIGTGGDAHRRGRASVCFNSPVGIRWIGTYDWASVWFYEAELFQFPSRNSMDWDTVRRCRRERGRRSFNSPVGIRWIGTSRPACSPSEKRSFQFPSRNSMDWDVRRRRSWGALY